MAGRRGLGRRTGARGAIMLILAWGWLGAAFAGGLPVARDLAREARAAASSAMPLVVLFSQPDCIYCERLRRDYLGPLAAQGAAHFVEVDITSSAPLAGFDARPGSHSGFAREQGVRITPTLAFLDSRGAPLAEPLVGFTSPDFYQSYLDRRLDRARSELARRRP